jgi:hypothetical protein
MSIQNVDKQDFEYPFGQIDPDPNSDYTYSIKSITKILPGQPKYQAGPFPNNIRHWIWACADEMYYNEGKWRILCELNSGLFAYFEADCDTTGFFCQGSISLFLSPKPSNLVTQAMTDAAYSLYMPQTVPAPCWSCWDADTAARRLAWAMLDHRRLGAARLWASLGKDLVKSVGEKILGEQAETDARREYEGLYGALPEGSDDQ